MMNLEKQLVQATQEAIKSLYSSSVEESVIQLQETKKEFEGDLTLVVFPFLKISRKSPEVTANEIGESLKNNCELVDKFNVIKGFLNISIRREFWIQFLKAGSLYKDFGIRQPNSSGRKVMIEYSSPNTNKPLHLGHIRNNLLGYSLSKILQANGHEVIKVNLVNDRGIHICKSMLAWQKWGNGITPEKAGEKGDHLVGDYYVKFDQEYKKQIAELIAQGLSQDEAEKKAPVILEAQEMLRKWEAKDPEVTRLWETMNHWVYDGFNETYKKLGVDFDRIYYESQTYLLGKEIVQKGLEKGVFYQRPDSSVWVNLTSDGLDEKLLLRSDGTSVYMTQDLGTAAQRFEEYKMDELIYVVGNEQNYHFQVLSLVMDKLGYAWAKNLQHMSYGMVELPSGKMKSREGTVVDADDLVDEMISTAREMSQELGKLDGFTPGQKDTIVQMIGLAALKYFILKVDPKKNMLFDPKESIDFNGNTGPFVQYTHARIQSLFQKAKDRDLDLTDMEEFKCLPNEKETILLKLLYRFPEVVADAGKNLSPALIANYVFELAKEYNQFYHDYQILKEEDKNIRNMRLVLSKLTGQVIKQSMNLLGINVPDRM